MTGRDDDSRFPPPRERRGADISARLVCGDEVVISGDFTRCPLRARGGQGASVLRSFGLGDVTGRDDDSHLLPPQEKQGADISTRLVSEDELVSLWRLCSLSAPELGRVLSVSSEALVWMI